MFILSYAGFFYGPFKIADEAAAYAEWLSIGGPWQIIKLKAPTK